MSKIGLFRLEHISVCINKILQLADSLEKLENFEER